MRALACSALLAALSAPAFCTDLVVTQTKHTDAFKMAGREAKDTTETMWIGKDRMRIESDDKVVIIRTDQKKMYMIDPRAKTYSTLDMPVDMKKYLPEEMAPMYEDMMAKTKITVTPTTETKKIHDWNATKYAMVMTMPMPGPMGGEMKFTNDIWVTKDVAVDRAAWNEMYGAMMTMGPGGPTLAAEMKKIDGLPVLIERTQVVMGNEIKSRDEVTAVTSKDAPEGTYDVPKDFTEKPFDPSSQGGMGGPPRHKGGKPADAGGEKGGGKGGDTPPVPPK
jgi:hypothetical protein